MVTAFSSGNLGFKFFAWASSHVTGCATSRLAIRIDVEILILYSFRK